MSRKLVLWWMQHDFGDVWLNWAKVSKYLAHERLTTGLFIGFVIAFFATRLVLLPLAIIPSGYFVTGQPHNPFSLIGSCFPRSVLSARRRPQEAMQIEPQVPGFLPMNVALVMLQALHVFWFWLVIKAVSRFVSTGPDDLREDED